MRKPNLIIPLATSYNQRGVQAATNATNAIDQRKINAIYEVDRNAITSSLSFHLTKRPGVTDVGTNYGSSSSNVPYLILNNNLADIGGEVAGAYVTNGGTIYAASSGGINFTICGVTATGALPLFADITNISGVPVSLVQIGTSAFIQQQRVFYNDGAEKEITDGDFPASSASGKMEFMDGFAFIMSQGWPGKIFNSDLNSLANWTAANFISRGIKQDYGVALARYKNIILGFGSLSVEAFYNAGNASGSPLSPVKHLQADIGISMSTAMGVSNYYCLIDDMMYFVGKKDESIWKSLFKFNGSSFVEVSNPSLSKMLTESTIYSLNAVNIFGKKGLNIRTTPVTDATQKSLVYFPQWNDWFEWNSTKFFVANDARYFLGLSANSKGQRLYKFISTDNWQDDGASYQFATQFKLPGGGPDRKRMEEFGVIGDTKAANTLTVEVSDDDYGTFTTKATLDLSTARKSTTRGGTYIDRVIRLSNTNALETRLQSFTALVK